ncbi:MAG: DUF4334 domain-containing protein [Cyanobacteria bacterium P01_E01_bin.35]
MNTLEIQSILQQETTTTIEALELFDQLDTVGLEFMIGRWQGSGFNSNHQMDGLLETIGWYGKEFVDQDLVHPLLFADGNEIFKVDPNPVITEIGLGLSILQHKSLQPLYQGMSKMLKTEKSKARIRMMEYRDHLSATMIYDYLPIHDVFRKIDDNTVFGLMDWKGMSQPFFFILKRT